MLATSKADSAPAPEQRELWFQQSTGNTRYVSGADDQKLIRIRNGRQATSFLEHRKSATINIAETNDALFLNVAHPILGYRYAVTRGAVSPVRDSGALRVEGNAFGGTYVARIDPDTLLPLEETYYDSQKVVAHHVKWTYTLIESVPAESIPLGLFDFNPGNEVTVESRAYLLVEDATKITGFPVYFLGPSYEGLDLAVIIHSHASGPGYARSSPTGVIERVEVIYQNNAQQQQLNVSTQPAAAYRPREITPGQLAPSTPVNLNSGPGVVYGEGTGMSVVITMNESVVTVTGAQALDAANRLVKVN